MLAELITEIQSLGLQVEMDSDNRRVGAGPAEGGTIIINGIPAHVPFTGKFISSSPYSLRSRNGDPWIVKYEKFLVPVVLKGKPKFYDFHTINGIPFSKIALLHGDDCIASTVRQNCVYWNNANRCQFCGIELSLETGQTTRLKTPSELAEVIAKAVELDSVSHAVLTTGALWVSGKEIEYLATCVEAIKESTSIPIHVQFIPPDDLDKLYALKTAGADTVGIHIESFDMDILAKVAPVKAQIGIEKYERTWNHAVKLFGIGQVSSFILVGLGESEVSVIKGSEFLATRGVYPFILPFRPIPGSMMEQCAPPDHNKMKRIYRAVAKILKKNGLTAAASKAGCVRCGACSALQAYEKELATQITCRPTVNEAEIAAAMEIRQEVFVKEQHLFELSDRDEFDVKSTHIIVKNEKQVIGTVRVYPVNGNSLSWIGGRLAVRRNHRDNHIGELLVREAMRYVKHNGCRNFTAHIQEQNIGFFKSLGWNVIGPLEMYHGKAHRQMEADLNTI